MNTTQLQELLTEEEIVTLQTVDGKELEIWGGTWCNLLTVDGVTVKNTKTLAPIVKKINEFKLA